MSDFKVPYGVDKNGDLIRPGKAVKGEIYKCINCGLPLVLKAGEIRIKHFSHKVDVNCNPESVIHKLAKRLIKIVIRENAAGIKPLTIQINCDSCKEKFDVSVPVKTFSNGLEEVSVGEFRCDVVGYKNKLPALGIEIFHTHKVNESKENSLTIPWVELNSEDIIDNPYQWIPSNYKLKPAFCKKCKVKRDRITDITRRYKIDPESFTIERNINRGSFIADLVTCYKCKKEIPVFWWKDVPFSTTKPPLPQPHTIEYRYSKTHGGSYYMNTCPNCHAPQGDAFLFLFENAPFSDLPTKRNSSTVPIPELSVSMIF